MRQASREPSLRLAESRAVTPPGGVVRRHSAWRSRPPSLRRAESSAVTPPGGVASRHSAGRSGVSFVRQPVTTCRSPARLSRAEKSLVTNVTGTGVARGARICAKSVGPESATRFAPLSRRKVDAPSRVVRRHSAWRSREPSLRLAESSACTPPGGVVCLHSARRSRPPSLRPAESRVSFVSRSRRLALRRACLARQKS